MTTILRHGILVGDWAKRFKRGVPHYVESIVANDIVTRCGRRMKDEPNRDGELVWAGNEPERCRVCDRR